MQPEPVKILYYIYYLFLTEDPKHQENSPVMAKK